MNTLTLRTPFVLCLLLLVTGASTVLAGDLTVVGTVALNGLSSRWIGVEAPLTGDDNSNGHSLFEIGSTAAGPFSSAPAGFGALTGPTEWRTEVFSRGMISPGTTYFVRVTYVDPDGVSGANPQILGPVTTPASTPNAVNVGSATADPRDTEIFVSLPISDDANNNSYGTVDVATGPGGPWTRECGSPSDANLPFQPKRCRVRGLIPGTDYWIRITAFDPDGVVGSNPQVLGPVHYSGLRDLALGRPITAEPGWGCCPSPSHLVDGRIQNDAWFYGFAWTGGLSHWAGGPDGFKHATVDLGSPTIFSRAAMWHHDPGTVPVVWKFQYSHDGSNWFDLHIQTQPMCRTATLALPGAWYYPACAHEAAFPAVTARYFRYTFDDRTLFGGMHGWAVELELFDAPPANEPPVANSGPDQQAAAGAGCMAEVTLDGTGSSDSDGDVLTYSWSGPFGTASGASPSVTLPLGVHTVTLTVDDGNGGMDTDEIVVEVVDLTPPMLANVPAPVTAECASPSGTPVALPLPTATDECDGPVSVASDAPAFFPLGTTLVTFTATDAAGSSASATTTVTVADTTPPVIAGVGATPGLLWPPNHKMKPVTVSVSAADVCDAPPPVCTLVGVTSNEPVNGLGDGDTAPDWQITGALTAKLRAERSGNGSGRIYTLSVLCEDAAGNAAPGAATVKVPHNAPQ